jgi:Polysaccharide deacetylase
MNQGVPFAEEGGKLRGFLDLASGCYPRFVLGGDTGTVLPVFHFHEVNTQKLEPYLRYLSENGYRTVTSDAIARYAKEHVPPGLRRVALCFDDAWASLWTVAYPLLARYGLSAITYAIPARIQAAESVRPNFEQDPRTAEAVDRSDNPFVTWPELRTMADSGIVDIQSHTYSHSRIYCSPRVIGFVTPHFLDQPLLARPRRDDVEDVAFLGCEDLGAPIYVNRSRMADAPRYFADPDLRQRCVDHVAAAGGAGFFERPGWRNELLRLVGRPKGHYEAAATQERAIFEELARARQALEQHLGTETVRQVCFPWGVAGDIARAALAEAGYDSAFADHLFGFRAVRGGDDPHRLMRLPHRYIFRLPGRSRRSLVQVIGRR